MLIGICGSICSGKNTVAQYLVDHHGFTHVFVKAKQGVVVTSSSSTSSQEPPAPPAADTEESNTHHKRSQSSSTSLVFSSPENLLEHVTQRWRDRWVITDVLSKDVLDAYSRRPFFLLISVDAPLLVRWKRYQQRHLETQQPPPPSPGAVAQPSTGPTTTSSNRSSLDRSQPPAQTLEAFAAISDAQLYHPLTGQATHISSAPVRLLNTSRTLASLYVNLGKLDLLSAERLRPSWDSYFMSLATLASHRSNCMKRRVGCVVVSHNRRVISTGYNGTPRGIRNCSEGGCPRCNSGQGSGHGLATCLCIHAEENALLEAGRDRLREDAVLYCDTCPCLTCSIKIAQVGVSEVVYAQGYSMDRETAAVFREAGVRLRQFVPPANGLIHLEKMELNI